MAVIRIRQDRFGRWSGYTGTMLVKRFYGEYAARRWMTEQVEARLRELSEQEAVGRKGFTFKYTDKLKD